MAELTREDLIEHLRNGISLEHSDLNGLDLRGIDFSKANLKWANLAECRLDGSRFTMSNMAHANLEEANLTGCNLSEVNLSDANLHKAVLFQSNLANSKLANADFRSADLSQADCTNADMTKGNFQRAKCGNTDFRNTVLAEADFRSAFLRGALFRGANLHGANLEGALGLDAAIALGSTGPELPVNLALRKALPGLVVGAFGAEKVVDYGAARPIGSRTPGGKSSKESKYHAELKHIPALIFTTGGWIRGVFGVPVMHGFLEHLNLIGDMFRLTNVNLPYLKLELRFFGLRRGKALLVLPDCDINQLNLPLPTADYHVHRVSFLLEGGTVTGSLAIEEDIRVSDYLANHDKFVVLRNCRFGAHDAPMEEEAHFPLLLVNCAAMVGASDERIKA
jgi:uncharacterized protein YjbI with pentapeptide repeats